MRRAWLVALVLVVGCGDSVASPAPMPDAAVTEAPADPTCRAILDAVASDDAGALVDAIDDLQGIESLGETIAFLNDTEGLTDEVLAAVGPDLMIIADAISGVDCDDVSALVEQRSAPAFDVNAVLAALEAAEAQWGEAAVDTYDIAIGWGNHGASDGLCGAGGDIVARVSGGSVEIAVERLAGCEIDVEAFRAVGGALSVPELFAFIRANLGARFVKVSYDDTYGLPTSILIEDGPEPVEVHVSSFGPRGNLFEQAVDVIELAEHQRQRWSDLGIDSYTFVLERICFCPPEYSGPFRITVRDGVVVAVERDGETASIDDGVTIDGIFDEVIENAYADAIDVDYSTEFHFPLWIDVDPSFNSIDEEVTFGVSEFLPE